MSESSSRGGRAEQVHRVSEGIKAGRITDADFLAVALQSSAKKKLVKKTEEIEQNDENKVNLMGKFDLSKSFSMFHVTWLDLLIEILPGVCDPFSRGAVDIPPIPTFTTSPYKVMEPYLEKHSKMSIARLNSESSPATLKELSPSALDDNDEENNENDEEDMSYESGYTGYNSEDILDEPEEPQGSQMDLELQHSQGQDISNRRTKIREMMTSHILQILNEGSYTELRQLRGIGEIRAMKIFTQRNAGIVFEHLHDLEAIGMNDKNIERFIAANGGCALLNK